MFQFHTGNHQDLGVQLRLQMGITMYNYGYQGHKLGYNPYITPT
jgi:hypothetical protein